MSEVHWAVAIAKRGLVGVLGTAALNKKVWTEVGVTPGSTEECTGRGQVCPCELNLLCALASHLEALGSVER